ncbi:MAG TPA: hypothetical protein VF688_05085 [Allosphingosinicella sp.]|jgi:hypothetical protein
MRMIALAGVALALAACGGGGEKADEANTLAADNMMMDDNLMMDGNASMNGMNGMGGMDANASMGASTENMMMQDAASNDADTNLANGL